jgi:peptidoglycan/xylan/chitin deacetylase (PgdA/CDA1 family)
MRSISPLWDDGIFEMRFGGFRSSVLKTAKMAGLFSRAADSASRRRRLLILCYHGIAMEDEDQWLGHLFISRARFERRLELLHSFAANVLHLGEALDHLRKGTLPPRSVVITFDDGYVDFHQIASPLMEKYRYPSTLYLSTYYCLHRLPVFNLMVNYLMWKSGKSLVELPEFGVDRPVPISNFEQRQEVFRQLLAWSDANQLKVREKDGIARSLATTLELDYDSILATRILQLMTPSEVADTARAGVRMELHTHRHRTPNDRDLFLREIQDNRACIREFAGREPTHFCYPSGNYDSKFFPWLSEAGVESATTCEPGLASAEMNWLLAPRFLDDSVASEIDFERWLSGFAV